MKNRIKVIASLLAGSSLWSGNVAARTLVAGECVDPSQDDLLFIPGMFSIDPALYESDSGSDYPLVLEYDELILKNDSKSDLFCLCDDSDDTTSPIDPDTPRKWVYDSAYTDGYPIVSNTGGYQFIDMPGMPFNVGTLINHGDKGYVSVPAQSVVYSSEGCVENSLYDEQSGQLTTGETANRALKLVIEQTGDIPPGRYTFYLPGVVSHKKLIPIDHENDSGLFLHTESAMVLQVDLSVSEQCSFGGNSIFTVNLGAVASNDFGEGDKPAEYTNKSFDVTFTCNGNSSNKTDFRLVDGNDPTNISDILTTDLDGVGIGIDHDGIRLNMMNWYNNSIGLNDVGAGTLSLEAYPVKVGEEPVGVGIYRAKATLVVEHY